MFDSPATPKTILEKSANQFKSVKFSQLSINNNNIPVSSNDILAKPIDISTPLFSDKPKAVPIHRSYENILASANVNPFTPPGKYKIYTNCNISTCRFYSPAALKFLI